MTDKNVPDKDLKEEYTTDDNEIIELKEEMMEEPQEEEDIIDLFDTIDQPAVGDGTEDAAADVIAPEDDEMVLALDDEISKELDLDKGLKNDIADSLGMELDSSEDDSKDLFGLEDVSEEAVEAALERVIKKMFYEKIDRVLVEVIEKTVTKEIERLKGVLLEDATDKEK
jgi:hypothetical protein